MRPIYPMTYDNLYGIRTHCRRSTPPAPVPPALRSFTFYFYTALAAVALRHMPPLDLKRFPRPASPAGAATGATVGAAGSARAGTASPAGAAIGATAATSMSTASMKFTPWLKPALVGADEVHEGGFELVIGELGPIHLAVLGEVARARHVGVASSCLPHDRVDLSLHQRPCRALGSTARRRGCS